MTTVLCYGNDLIVTSILVNTCIRMAVKGLCTTEVVHVLDIFEPFDPLTGLIPGGG